MEKNRKSKFLVFVRHGERADQAEQVVEQKVDNDPLLTELGLRQARSAGRFLHEYFVEKPGQATADGSIPKVKIITSPYMRTVMTAAEVARAFGESTITVENRLCEL